MLCNLDNLFSQNLEIKNILYKNYISYFMGGNNNIDKTKDEIIKHIIIGSW